MIYIKKACKSLYNTKCTIPTINTACLIFYLLLWLEVHYWIAIYHCLSLDSMSLTWYKRTTGEGGLGSRDCAAIRIASCWASSSGLHNSIWLMPIGTVLLQVSGAVKHRSYAHRVYPHGSQEGQASLYILRLWREGNCMDEMEWIQCQQTGIMGRLSWYFVFSWSQGSSKCTLIWDTVFLCGTKDHSV